MLQVVRKSDLSSARSRSDLVEVGQDRECEVVGDVGRIVLQLKSREKLCLAVERGADMSYLVVEVKIKDESQLASCTRVMVKPQNKLAA